VAGAEGDRARLRAALIGLVAEAGSHAVTAVAVTERAGLGAEAFERAFPGLSFEECLAEVWQESTQEFLERTGGAYAAAGGWREGLRAAAWAYCRFLQDDRERARFLIDVTFAGEMVHANRDFVMDAYTELVHLGRFEREEAAGLDRVVAEGIVGAIWEWAANGVRTDTLDRLPTQVPGMMYLTVLPYLGADAAMEELQRGPADLARYERGEL